MLCVSCTHENKADASFCKACGTRLGSRCGQCGTSLSSGARFCDGCGARVVAETVSTPAVGFPFFFAGGRYEARRLLGEGSGKRVFLAHDHRLDRDVALALIKTDGLDEAGLTRVRREMRATGRLGDHPHIVTVFDVGDEDSQPYLISRYMAGGSVQGLIHEAEGHTLSRPVALRIAAQICEALIHAHAQGIVHRDLKPANVWLSADGTAHLGDFGLALAVDRSRLTLEGVMIGTASYMAPEQALGRPADPRSDLYALGAMLYEMVTGRPPFSGDDPVAVIAQHLNTPPVAPSWHNAGVTPRLETLILRLLAKSPEQRPQDASSVRTELSELAEEPAVDGAAEARRHPDDANPLDRLAGGVFVGRDAELSVLRSAVDGAIAGQGRVVMLIGEPGIGKTRTAEALATYAQIRGARILVGRCYEEEGMPAYWPWIQVLRAYTRERNAESLRAEMGSGAGEIARMVSEVGETLRLAPTPSSPDPDLDRLRLFESITNLLRRSASATPLVVVLDDLHWVDKPSLLFLQFLARDLGQSRVLIIGTFRDAGLGRQHALSQAISDLTRLGICDRLPLEGLSEPEVARFIEMTTGGAPVGRLVATVYRETDGNPFFVAEIVRLLAADEKLLQLGSAGAAQITVPQTIREVIGRRLDHLTPECRRVLTIAAVLGREFALDALERMETLPPERLLGLVEEAVSARIVDEVPGVVGRFVFHHALIRGTLYEDLTTTRRARMHAQVGAMLESLYATSFDAHVAELAYHFGAAGSAGNLDKAFEYGVRAGDRAVALMGHEQAVGHYEGALRVLELLGDERGEQRCWVLLRQGEALWQAGESQRGRAVCREASEIARRLRVPAQFAEAALGFGSRFLGVDTGRVDAELVAILDEALAMLGDSPSPLRTIVMARLAEALTFGDPDGRRRTLCREALDAARADGDPLVLTYALRAMHWALWSPDNLVERIALATEMHEVTLAAGFETLHAECGVMFYADLLERGETSAAKAMVEQMKQLSERMRQPALRWGAEAVLTVWATLEGRFTEAEHHAEEALQAGLRSQLGNAPIMFAGHIGMLRREQGRYEELEAVLEGLGPDYPALDITIRLGAIAALAERTSRPAAELQADLMRLVEGGITGWRRDFLWLWNVCAFSEACSVLHMTSLAGAIYELLLPFRDRVALGGPTGMCAGSVEYPLGLLAALGERWDDASEHFEAALRVNERLGARPYLARTQQAFASMLASRGDPQDRARALAFATSALEAAQHLGMRGLVERCLGQRLRLQGAIPTSAQSSIDAVADALYRDPPDLRAQAAPDGTVTILFTDIAESSTLMQQLGDERWLALLQRHNAMVRREVALRRGLEVKGQGDGFMIAFSSARRAVRCALAIQQAFAVYNQGPAEFPVHVRMGLHTGEALQDRGDFFGRSVVTAARVAAAAGPDEVLVTGVVKDLVQGAEDVTFVTARELVLKGLSGTQHVFSVRCS